jgi:hypothetical protein
MFSKVMSERISAILARIVSVLLVGFILASCVWEGFPADTVRENITFDEAQDLVDFPICLPTYISEGVEPTPNIIFEADSANVPEETYIRLRYNRQDTQEKIIEVFQRWNRNILHRDWMICNREQWSASSIGYFQTVSLQPN